MLEKLTALPLIFRLRCLYLMTIRIWQSEKNKRATWLFYSKFPRFSPTCFLRRKAREFGIILKIVQIKEHLIKFLSNFKTNFIIGIHSFLASVSTFRSFNYSFLFASKIKQIFSTAFLDFRLFLWLGWNDIQILLHCKGGKDSKCLLKWKMAFSSIASMVMPQWFWVKYHSVFANNIPWLIPR